MALDTQKTIYVGIDSSSGDIKLLVPRDFNLEIIELRLDDRDPQSTDAAEHKLLAAEMDEHAFDL